MSTRPLVLYVGPSVLDGSPIVALATLASTNVKTGPMVQTWIMRADIGPVDAVRTGLDSSVCGSCPRRHALGGDCYVQPFQAPRSVWASWERSGKPGADVAHAARAMASEAIEHGLRLGSYGDPFAVPHAVWVNLLALIPGKVRHTGYTHQWRNREVSREHLDWTRANLMASVDSVDDAIDARWQGWRYFLALAPGHVVPLRTVMCLADDEKRQATCETCRICDGAQGRADRRVSVYIAEHGARSTAKNRARRSAHLGVVQ